MEKWASISLLKSIIKFIFVFISKNEVYRCESWTRKKAEHQRIDTFELRCWRRLLRVPQTAGRSKQSILKEINPKYSLEGLMLKLQYFGHPMRRADSLGKILMLGKVEGRRRRGQQRMKNKQKGSFYTFCAEDTSPCPLPSWLLCQPWELPLLNILVTLCNIFPPSPLDAALYPPDTFLIP